MNIRQQKKKLLWQNWYAKNKVWLNKRRTAELKIEYAKNKSLFRQKEQIRRDNLKLLTFQKYSKLQTPICLKCGFSDLRALCLDHTNNNGNKDRKENMGRNLGGSGSRFYAFLKRNNFPKGYQVLCANCNLIKEIERRKQCRKKLTN
jgi:hypothetical protein